MILGFELFNGINTNNKDIKALGWYAEDNESNPYSVERMVVINLSEEDKKVDQITSIPSPYARLHITQSALIEGGKVRDGGTVDFNTLPRGYRRAISHLLDTFELVYRFSATELYDKGISITRHKYEDNGNTKLVEPLKLFRDNYGKENFNYFYKISRDGNPLAYTSPFTVFFTPEDISRECKIEISTDNKPRMLYSDDENEWSGIDSRPDDIKEFLYAFVLCFAGSNGPYKELFDYVQKSLGQDFNGIKKSDYFKTNYPQFVTDGTVGVRIKVDNPKYNNVELLPLGYDRFAFQNLVSLVKKDYSAVEDSSSPKYDVEITERKDIFSKKVENESNASKLQWITIHDLLEDDIFRIDTQIDNEKYLAIHSKDEDAGSFILPFKKRFFELFNLDADNNEALMKNIDKWVSIEWKESQGIDEQPGTEESGEQLVVTLSLPTERIKDNNVERVSVSKTYTFSQIHTIDIDFGIYPFLQVNEYNDVKQPDNFYRIMLYLSNSSTCDINSLNVYQKESNSTNSAWSYKVLKNDEGKYHIQRHATFTEEKYPGIGDNLYYLSLESKYILDNIISNWKDVRFDFVEANIDGHTVLFVPRLVKNSLSDLGHICAVDLGTSNTYVAYSDEGKNTTEFEDDNVQLVGKLCYKDGAERYYDFTQGGIHQHVEFLPTQFGRGDYAHFPIQSIQLFPNVVLPGEMANSGNIKGAPFVSMFSMNIPFLYNKNGVRMVGTNTVDNTITNFKWFSTDAGKQKELNALTLFVDQLCFMLRNKVVMKLSTPNSTKLIWMYPLSMTSKNYYEQIWEKAYKKYFGTDSKGKLISFTESETPIEMFNSVNGNLGFRVGIDIGGGSTDVIGYNKDENKQVFASSFSFAGNAMFGKLYGDKSAMQNSENIWYKTIRPKIEINDNQEAHGLKTKTVDVDPQGSNITEIMDYVFCNLWRTNETKYRSAFDSSKHIRFVNLFHTCAIVWETAQLCKKELIDNKTKRLCEPNEICFSGNGSKLILVSEFEKEESINENGEVDKNARKIQILAKIVNIIFSKVYEKEITDITVSLLAEPKKATAQGAINLVRNGHTESGTEENIIRFNDIVCSSGGETESSKIDLNDMIEEENMKKIAADVGVFLELFFDIAVGTVKINEKGTSPAGKWFNNDVSDIKKKYFDDSYYSEKMIKIIENAQAILKKKNSVGEKYELKDSVFLAVVAQIECEFIKSIDSIGKNRD